MLFTAFINRGWQFFSRFHGRVGGVQLLKRSHNLKDKKCSTYPFMCAVGNWLEVLTVMLAASRKCRTPRDTGRLPPSRGVLHLLRHDTIRRVVVIHASGNISGFGEEISVVYLVRVTPSCRGSPAIDPSSPLTWPPHSVFVNCTQRRRR